MERYTVEDLLNNQKKALTNKEWVEIDKRKKNGERLADILSEMKVLK